MNKPKISICIPYYPRMKNAEFFMERCLESIKMQIYTDYEVVITKEGNMAQNTNNAIKAAKGDIIKILYMDDYFLDKDSLQEIANIFDEKVNCNWLATGCIHNVNGELTNPHLPEWTDDITNGNNKIGSPSVISFRNDEPLLFDEKLGWMLDIDLYKRMYDRYGEPEYLYDYNVVIGIHPGQATNILSTDKKENESTYIKNKYEYGK